MKNLKKNQNETIKSIFFTMLIMVALLLQSCETEVPDTDMEPPLVSLLIKGVGLDHTFNSSDGIYDFGELYLTDGATYTFSLIVADNGGINKATLGHENGFMNIVSYSPASWFISSVGVDNIATNYNWNGDENNPVTGTALTGTFTVNGDNDEFILGAYADDFGGESGDGNLTSFIIKIIVWDRAPSVGYPLT